MFWFRLAYSSVRKEHSGTYGCTGNNGFGQPSTQLVTVRIKRKLQFNFGGIERFYKMSSWLFFKWVLYFYI